MSDWFVPLWDRLVVSVRDQGRYADRATRHAVFSRCLDVLPRPLRTVIEKTTGDAYKVTDEEIAALRTHSEDHTFELLVCAAIGAADRTLRTGLSVLQAAKADRAGR